MVMVSTPERAGNVRCEAERRRRARNSGTNKRLHRLVTMLQRVKVLAGELTEEVVGEPLRGYMSVGECLGLQEDLLVVAYNANVGIGFIDSVTLPPDGR